MSNLRRAGGVYHISKADKFLNLRTPSQKSSYMAEAMGMWEARSCCWSVWQCRGLQQISSQVLGLSRAGRASEPSQPLAMAAHLAALLTGSLAHFWPIPKNIPLNWGMYSWGSSGRSHAPGTVPSRWHLAWEARTGHSEPCGWGFEGTPDTSNMPVYLWGHNLGLQPGSWDNPTAASPHFFPFVGIESTQYQSQHLYKYSIAVGFMSVCSMIASIILNADFPIPLNSTSECEEKHYGLRNSQGCRKLLM